MTYEEALQFIDYTNSFGSRLGLDSIRELLNRLGNPQNRCKVIHIAGTNGKGSIFAFLESGLRQGGYRVGRYISPTIFTYLERFQINGSYMKQDVFASLAERVAKECQQMEAEGFLHPTAFEVETAIVFLYFVQEQVDVVLLETGMGGREDATNVVEKPLATVFASISKDHMAFLGDTLAEIAYQKAGIMRDKTPCVLAPMAEEARETLRTEAKRLNCPVVEVDENAIEVRNMSLEGTEFAYDGTVLNIALLGNYQIHNAITALLTYEIVQNDLPMDKAAFCRGMSQCVWQGRFELLQKKPYVIRDGAHNEDAVKQLAKTLKTYFKDQKIRFVMGVLKDKEHALMIDEILPLAKSIFTITPPIAERALAAETLAQEIRMHLKEQPYSDVFVQSFADVKEAVEETKKISTENEVIVIFGSLSFIGGCIY